jgi:hypothetical protein
MEPVSMFFWEMVRTKMEWDREDSAFMSVHISFVYGEVSTC